MSLICDNKHCKICIILYTVITFMTDKKQPQKEVEASPLIVRLTSFGFSVSEAKIYVYLLEKGTDAGGSKIAQSTGLHRQYVYLAIPRLIELGLVDEVPHGKQNRYKARPPSEIEKIGRKRALMAGDLARDLNAISNIGNEQEFEVLQGTRAIQEYELHVALCAEDGDEECIIGGASTSFGELMDGQLNEYLDIKEKKKIRVKYLGTEDERPSYAKYIGKFENQEYRFMKKLPKGKTHMLVRKDSVSFYTFLNPPLVYVVKSPVVAENYKQFFMMLWEMAGE